jgi:hypothetical protein
MGRRLPSEYLPDRAARINFIAAALKDKGVRIYRCIARSKRLVYTVRTGPDEHFLVFVHDLPTANPRLAYVTSYYVSDDKFVQLTQEEWERMYPKANKPSLKGQGNRKK